MKLVIHSVSSWDHPNIRTWEPEDPSDIVEDLTLHIGARGGKGTEMFTLRIATPAGLSKLCAKDGIVATRPLLVIDRFDFHSLWAWLERTVKSCEGETWLDCVHELRVYFMWEYEGLTP